MSNNTLFKVLVLYLFFEYARPQSFISLINYFHPGIIIVLILIIALYINGRLIDIERLKENPTKYFLLLLLLMAIHVPIATNNYWALQIFKNTVALFVVYLGIINYVDSYDKLRSFVIIWIIINMLGAFNGVMNGGRIPNSAFMGDENDFALVMNMTIPMAFFMFPTADSGKKKILLACCIFFCALGSVLSLSRGGFIGLAAVGFFCWMKSSKKVATAIIVTVLAILVLSFAPVTYMDEIKSITEENVSSGTGYARWYMWQRGWDMFLDNFVIGVGQGNYPYNVGRYEPEDISVYWHSHAGRPCHSLYVTLISELGAAGLLIYLTMLIKTTKDVKSRFAALNKIQLKYDYKVNHPMISPRVGCYRSLILGMYGALFGYLVSGAFLSVLYYPHLYLVLAILVALRNIMKNEEENDPYKENA